MGTELVDVDARSVTAKLKVSTSTPIRFTSRSCSSPEHSEVFTRRWVVELILDLAGYTADRDLGSMRAVEPSCGAGAFLGPMVERLVRFRRIRRWQ